MKTILCYGDSNTYGFNPIDFSRYEKTDRWTEILQKNLNNEYKIIEEGACDRTGFVDNPKGDFYSAQKHFLTVLSKRYDIIIISIGTNDLQFQYNIDFKTVESGLENIIKYAKNKTDKIIIIPPVILNTDILNGFFKIQFDDVSVVKSKEIGVIYKEIAQKQNCNIFDINEFAKPSNVDGLHYDKNSHKIIADKLTNYILLMK